MNNAKPSTTPLTATITLTTKQPNLILYKLTTTPHKTVDNWSPFYIKIIQALQAHKLTYTSLHKTMPNAFTQHNPAKQIPMLLIDSVAMADSTEILHTIKDMTGTRSCTKS